MKLTKNVLKTVVKECLIEILSEGFNISKDKSEINISNAVNEAKSNTRRKTADLVRFENKVKETSNNLTSDPVLSSIFEDTAKTTLQEQLNSPQNLIAGDRASYAAATNDPLDLFGDSAGKWAALAFNESKK
tara:strand:+ start:240 stop:635 length:396 start_codon:yes stop_codon:yes gene_type:complete